MVVLASLIESLRLLRDHPILFVPPAAFALVQVPQLFVGSFAPSISIGVSLAVTGALIFVTPFVYAGAIGMANDVSAGLDTSLDRFWLYARSQYLTVLLAYLFIGAVISAAAVVIFVSAAVTVAGLGVTTVSVPIMVAAGGVALLVVLVFLIGLFSIHFYAHAIVIEHTGAISGMKRSIDVVRHNLKPVVGYGAISLGVGAAVCGIYSLIVLISSLPVAPVLAQPASPPAILPAALATIGMVSLSAIYATVVVAFSVVVFRELIGATEHGKKGPGRIAVDRRSRERETWLSISDDSTAERTDDSTTDGNATDADRTVASCDTPP